MCCFFLGRYGDCLKWHLETDLSLNMEKAMVDKNGNLALQHSQICSSHIR